MALAVIIPLMSAAAGLMAGVACNKADNTVDSLSKKADEVVDDADGKLLKANSIIDNVSAIVEALKSMLKQLLLELREWQPQIIDVTKASHRLVALIRAFTDGLELTKAGYIYANIVSLGIVLHVYCDVECLHRIVDNGVALTFALLYVERQGIHKDAAKLCVQILVLPALKFLVVGLKVVEVWLLHYSKAIIVSFLIATLLVGISLISWHYLLVIYKGICNIIFNSTVETQVVPRPQSSAPILVSNVSQYQGNRYRYRSYRHRTATGF